ncbi:MAG: AAA family ATPase [Rhodobacteraceae bacterium]|nr:AAA family ATPase [Paracoccaceae bacterium]
MLNSISITGYKGTDEEYALHPLTTIVGDMTAGKSTILEAIQLALTGKVEGVAETALADGISSEVLIHAEGEGITATFTVPWDGGPKMRKSSHDPQGFNPGTVLPVLALSKLANGGAALESAILTRFGQGALQVPASVMSALSPTWASIAPDWEEGDPLLASYAGTFLTQAKRATHTLGVKAGVLDRKAAGVVVSSTDMADLLNIERDLARYDKAVMKFGDNAVRAYLGVADKTRMRTFKTRKDNAKAAQAKFQSVLAMHESILKVAQAAKAAGHTEIECPLCSEGKMDVQKQLTFRKQKVVLLRVKVQTEQGNIAAASRGFQAVIDAAMPPVHEWQAKQATLQEAAVRQKMQTGWVQEAIDLRGEQRALQDAAKALKIALNANRVDAYAKASMKVDELSFPDFDLALRSDGPKWVVQTKAGAKWGSLSAAQKGAIMLAAPLVFGEEGEPSIILLDDEELKGFSAKGVHTLLGHFSDLLAQGVVDQVITTRHTDRAKQETPVAYHQIRVG